MRISLLAAVVSAALSASISFQPTAFSAQASSFHSINESRSAIEAAAESWGAAPTVARSLAVAATKTLTEKFEITPSAEGGRFGVSVALSGNRALIGASFDSIKGTYAGAAFTYIYNGTTWVEETRLTASDATEGDEFGCSVALEGTRAVIGAFNKTVDFLHKGGAYVFDFDGTTWNQTAILLAPDGRPRDYFGNSVALSGNEVIVGAPHKATERGAAYIFGFDGTAWVWQASISLPHGVTGDYLGAAVSISGTRALIGVPREYSASGLVEVYSFDGTNWNQETELSASDSSDDFFGASVCLVGTRAVIGAPTALDLKGAAYVFDFNGTTWSQTAELSASDGEEQDAFGTSVSMSGNLILVGAPQTANYPDPGKAYIYQRSGGTWIEKYKLLASDGMAQNSLGVSVSLSGKRALVGAQQDVGNEQAAYIFGR